MIYKCIPGRVSYGEAIGILLIENYVPFIPGDVANATTYGYPVRFQRIEGVTHRHLFSHDVSVKEKVLNAGRILKKEGVQAITGDCGFLALFQEEIKESLQMPVFLSSLLQLAFIAKIIPEKGKIGIITANAGSLTDSILEAVGVSDRSKLILKGLEGKDNFRKAVFEEAGYLDSELVEAEVIEAAGELMVDHPETSSILLECSLLPPYSSTVSSVTGLPVFDYISMIDYVHSAVVKKKYSGYM
ncbi:MAG: aspartate/glutamate racemase family protein [Thermovirga sp.]